MEQFRRNFCGIPLQLFCTLKKFWRLCVRPTKFIWRDCPRDCLISEKTQGSNGNSGFYSRVFNTAGVWLGWSWCLLALVAQGADVFRPGLSTRWLDDGWLLCLGMLVVTASARLPTRCLGVACRALDSQRVRPCAIWEGSPFSD